MHSAVTPFVGVWIETRLMVRGFTVPLVTPFVGVWIETSCFDVNETSALSHPSWVCGLKLNDTSVGAVPK